jgi:hypothetical protein
MRQEGILKHFIVAFVIALVFYFVGFSWIQHRREDKGPWQITFKTDAAGIPAISVAQSNLSIFETVSFPNGHATSNISETITFGQDVPELPFGKLIFHDPTFLPGTVTLGLFGHQVELLPRILTIDNKEYTWHSNEIVLP